MKLLITGSNGLLGQKIVRQLEKSGIDYVATSMGANRNPNLPNSKYVSFDITNRATIQQVCDEYQPTAIINTAAMTNVDACEDDEVGCKKLNVIAVQYLFDWCKLNTRHFIHLSTDFVFDGKNGPYSENDLRNPLSIYGKSKADSEDLLLNDSYLNWTILRTIIVFGKGENLSRSNIVLWAKSELAQGKKMNIVQDQFRAPTWADDLAWACIKVAKTNKNGVYHISGPETISMFELVKRIAKFYGFDENLVYPISSITLNQKAKRPPVTGFVLDTAKKDLGYNPLSFEDSLDRLG
jgi:dTDP-4-dehydrorhamnose reductase